MYRTTAFIILGFLLFLAGFISLVLMMVGLQLNFLAWIDEPGRAFGLVIRLLMVFGGVALVYVMRNKFQE